MWSFYECRTCEPFPIFYIRLDFAVPSHCRSANVQRIKLGCGVQSMSSPAFSFILDFPILLGDTIQVRQGKQQQLTTKVL